MEKKSVLNISYTMLCYITKEKYGKSYMILRGIISIFDAVFPIIYTILPGLIINKISTYSIDSTLIFLVFILVISPMCHHFINLIFNRIINKYRMRINASIYRNFYSHCCDIDFQKFEMPDIQLKRKYSMSALREIWSVCDIVFGLFSSLLNLVAVVSIISTLSPILILISVLCVLITTYVSKKNNSLQFELSKENEKNGLYRGAIAYAMFNIQAAKEVRLYNMKTMLLNKLDTVENKTIDISMKQQMIGNYSTTAFTIANFLQELASYIYIIYRVVMKRMPIGNMTIYLSSYERFRQLISTITNSYIGLSKIGLSLDELTSFLNVDKSGNSVYKKKPLINENSIIEFNNVSFNYPGNEKLVLKNFNLKIKMNEKLCVVGINGSGKTTFIKLLTGLYRPTSGKIFLDGIDITEFDSTEYMKLFAPVFQDYSLHSFSIGENIALNSNYDTVKLENICKKCGLNNFIEKLSVGFNTQMGKAVDPTGVTPSGGEGQRIAIARASYSEREIYILDEPTAALDPISENNIYTEFSELIGNKCAILITHRLSAVKLADKIAVFENGCVIEYGSHNDLINNNSVYADMYNKQASYYLNNNRGE